jgi:hypothetical protein
MARRPSRVRMAALLMIVLGSLVALAVSALPATAATDPLANTVLAFGGAPQLGPYPGRTLNASFINIAATRSGRGYWVVASDGGVFSYGDARFYGSTGALRLRMPVVDMAPTATGRGYWLVALDGGVFAFGDARFHGSLGGVRLAAPIIGIASTPTGKGYWMVGADGGVFAFGDARYRGSAATTSRRSPFIAMAPTPSARGYYLLAADGAVFTYGDARYRGGVVDPRHSASGIAVARNGGYWVSRRNGHVTGFGVPSSTGATRGDMNRHPTVAIAARPQGGFWLAQSWSPPPPPPPPAAPPHANLGDDPFLRCTRAHESDSSGGYRAVSAGGVYRGAYQFTRSTWDNTARRAGRYDLVGVDPAAAAPWDQDLLALTLYHWQGAAPWGGRCAGLP